MGGCGPFDYVHLLLNDELGQGTHGMKYEALLTLRFIKCGHFVFQQSQTVEFVFEPIVVVQLAIQTSAFGPLSRRVLSRQEGSAR
ncbi:hypothetical protein AJ88_43175 [Mesorhizobium amorphae CCBAU 01583]|nr:hypothetical protein AJ88_43175 [Mesorhizobium amorphae CCBAU 01583]